MIADFFAPLAIKIFTGVTLALAIALGVTMWRADSISADRDRALREVGAAETRHAVTTASLRALEGELAAFVAEGALRQERASEAILDAREAGAEVRRAAQEQGRTDWRGQEGL